MRRILSLAVVILASAIAAAGQSVNTITTVAGGGAEPGTAASAYLPEPFAAVRDTAGNTYISVPTLDEVFKVNTSGNLTVYAGTGFSGFSGDGGAATQAQLAFPEGLAIDKNGNLFIADMYNERIRRVDGTTHVITTVAGSEDPYYGNYAGDGGSATYARLNGPEGVAVDANGNLFIADTNNGVVRRVDQSTGIISTYAGGSATLGCPSGSASGAGFSDLTSVAVDASGNVFVSDQYLQVVCKVNTSQDISVYAGTLNSPGIPGQPNGDGGAATSALLLEPRGLTTDANGNLYIADAGNPKIREVVAATGKISTVAGIGLICTNAQEPTCGDGGAATSAEFNFPEGVFYDSLGNLVVTDTDNMRVRVVSSGANPTIAALVGGGTGGDGAAGTTGIMGLPQYLAVDTSENLYALEANGDRLRELSASTKDLSTVAGDGLGGATIDCNGTTCGSAKNGDGGPATQGRFVFPDSVAIDSAGNFYILDLSTAVVRAVNQQTAAITVAGVTIPPGDIETIAGNGAACGSAGNPNTVSNNCGDGGAATSASLSQPYVVAVDSNGIVYIGDAGLSTVRAVNTQTSVVTIAGIEIDPGDIATIAGTPGKQCTTYLKTFCGDSGAATSATLSFPIGLAVDSGNNVYIADAGDNVIRKVDTSGAISLYAFNGLPTFGGDDGLALNASMEGPAQLALDDRGNLYIGGGSDNVVQRVDAGDGTIVTVAGDVYNLDGGFSGDGGPSTSALIGNYGLAIFNTPTPTDDLFIADTGSNRVRRVNLSPVTIQAGSFVAFGPALVGSTNTPPQSIDFANDGLDDLILTVKCNACSPAFVLPPSNGPNGTYIFQVSPGSAGLLTVDFEPPADAPLGTVTGTISITTNDQANPTYSFSLTGTVAGPATLTASVNPTGDGTVISTDNTIICPPALNSTCTGTFPIGSTVALVAAANPGFAFQSWNVSNAPDAANCATDTTGFCSFEITLSESIGANFTTSTVTSTSYTITVAGYGNGNGTVTSTPSGISCTITNGAAGSTGCSASFTTANAPNGVTLTESGTGFDEWLGESCSASTQTTCTALPFTGTVDAVFSGPAVPFAKGQVFLDAGQFVFVLDPTSGDVVQVLKDTLGFGQGMTFDPVGNLDVALQSGYLSVFSNQAAGPTALGNYGGDNEANSVVFDPSGDALVGEAFITGDQQPTLLEYAAGSGATSTPSATFYPAYISEIVPAFWIELLDSNDTIAYTLGSTTVKVFDLGESVQHPDVVPNPALSTGETQPPLYALRELPDDTLLVAATSEVARVTQAGTVTMTYTIPNTSAIQNLNLDPDSVSFWTNDQVSGTVYRINLATGAVMNNNGSGFSTPLGELIAGGITGIAVYGQPQSGGADVAVTMTAPAAVTENSNITFTATVVNNGPLAATGVALTDPLPAGATFVSASTTVGSCTGTTTVACAIGTMNNGATATVTIIVTATQTGTLANTVNVTSTTPDSNLTNNTATTTTTVNTASSPLSITTTSPLPAATSGTTYSTALLATGGTTPYMWSVVTGALPPGLTLSAAGVISGTPTAAAAYSFEVQVQDSSSPVKTATATFSLTVNGTSAGGLTILTTTLPEGEVTLPYGADIAVTGGTPPYSFAVTTGTITSGLTLNTSTGHISGYPSGGTPVTFTITVTDSASNKASQQYMLTVEPAPANTGNSLLNGYYALLFRAFNESTKQEEAFVANLNFDSTGDFTGEADYILNGEVGTDVSVGGTYVVGPDNRGLMNFQLPNGTFQAFTIAVGNTYRGVAQSVLITNFSDDTGTGYIGSGSLTLVQLESNYLTTFPGSYVFGLSGQGTAQERQAQAGLIGFGEVNGVNAVTTGTADVNDAGTMSTIASIGGTFTTPDQFGRFPMSLTFTPGGTSSRVGYIISPNKFVWMTLDPPATNPILIGTALRQTGTSFSTSSILGPDGFTLRGLSSTGGGYDLIVGVATGGNDTLSVMFDENDDGGVLTNQTVTGALTVAANGRASAPLNGQTWIAYLANTDQGYSVGTSKGAVAGELIPQVGEPYATNPLTGTFIYGSAEALGSAGAQDSGVAVLSGSTYNLTEDISHSGGDLYYDRALGTVDFAVSSSGHFTTTATGTVGAQTGYVVSAQEVLLFDQSAVTGSTTPTSHPQFTVGLSTAAPPGTPSPTTETVSFPTPVAPGSTATSSSLTISNTGNGPLGITGVNVANSPDFSASGTCIPVGNGAVTVVEPQGSCTFTVAFAPPTGAASGAVSQTLVIDTDGTSNLTITATGTVGSSSPLPSLSITKTHSGNFTQGQQGATYTVTVSNGAVAGPTSGTVTVTDIAPSGLTILRMTGTGWQCGSTSVNVCTRTDVLAAGASYPPLTVTVNVATNATSPQVNSVTVSGGGSASVTATDSTIIAGAPAPVATLNPPNGSTLAFGNQTEGVASTAKTVALTNSGTAVLTVTSISITASAANFTETNNCPASLPVATTAPSTCTISIIFNPSTTGPVTGTLAVQTDDSNDPMQTISLTGTGLPSGPAVATLTPPNGSTLAFGNLMEGVASEAKTAMLTNTGGTALSVTGISINQEVKAFSQMNNCTESLGVTYPAASCTISVTFTPPSLGNFSGTLTVSTSDPRNPTQTISLTGTGVAGGTVALSATSLNFNDQVLTFRSSPQTVTVTNSGTGPLTITKITPSGDYAEADGCVAASPLAPNSTCTISVTFDPTTLGTRTGSVTLTDNVANSPQTISLTGVGTMVGLVTAPGSTTIVNVNPGGTAVYGLVLETPQGTMGTAQLGCTSPDATISCSVVPPSVKLTGKTVETAVVVNSYCTANTAPLGLPIQGVPLGWIGILCAVAILTFESASASGRRRSRLAVLPALLTAVLIVSAACGNLPKNPAGATQPGNYQLNITATLDNSTFTMPVTLIVN
jgi:uncharacterized repeat protein (TIGR01451 family)